MADGVGVAHLRFVQRRRRKSSGYCADACCRHLAFNFGHSGHYRQFRRMGLQALTHPELAQAALVAASRFLGREAERQDDADRAPSDRRAGALIRTDPQGWCAVPSMAAYQRLWCVLRTAAGGAPYSAETLIG